MDTIDIRKTLGFRKQLGDPRDRLFMPLHSPESLPPRVDLRPLCPPVLDQKELGSCTANAIASVVRFALRKQKARDFAASRLFIYYNERKMQGWENEDSGAYIRDGFKAINQYGACVESSWKYDISKFAVKPPERAYKTALKHQSIEYSQVNQTLSQLKACIADGFPFCFGFSVFDSFERIGRDGVMPYPSTLENLQGGHCVYACGYDEDAQMFTIRNSYGKNWGDGGDFYCPYSFITNRDLASDFWSVRLLEDNKTVSLAPEK
jgi:C1A family cysteine protease